MTNLVKGKDLKFGDVFTTHGFGHVCAWLYIGDGKTTCMVQTVDDVLEARHLSEPLSVPPEIEYQVHYNISNVVLKAMETLHDKKAKQPVPKPGQVWEAQDSLILLYADGEALCNVILVDMHLRECNKGALVGKDLRDWLKNKGTFVCKMPNFKRVYEQIRKR